MQEIKFSGFARYVMEVVFTFFLAWSKNFVQKQIFKLILKLSPPVFLE